MQFSRGIQVFLVGISLVTVFAPTSPSVAQALHSENHLAGLKDCQLEPPADWTDRQVIWEGDCKAGKADGQGVLKAYKKGEPTQIFFGSLGAGKLLLGVIEIADGYIAGQFEQGKIIPESERNVIINAFRDAGTAARAYSLRLEKEGNLTSAAFYLKKAQQLEQQMD